MVYPKFFEGDIRLQPDIHRADVVPHTHDFLELVYVLGGEATCAVNGVRWELHAGDYFVLDYHTEHSYCIHGEPLSIINCLFLPEALGESHAGARSFNELAERYFLEIAHCRVSAPPADRVFADESGRVRELLFGMVEEYRERRIGCHEILRCRLREIVIETVRQVGGDRQNSDLIQSLVHVADTRYATPLSLQELCRERHYSTAYVSARFRQETGMTFTEYVQGRRIAEACRLLSQSALPVSAVAESVGYTDVRFFSRLFARLVGMPPYRFRKKNGRPGVFSNIP